MIFKFYYRYDPNNKYFAWPRFGAVDKPREHKNLFDAKKSMIEEVDRSRYKFIKNLSLYEYEFSHLRSSERLFAKIEPQYD